MAKGIDLHDLIKRRRTIDTDGKEIRESEDRDDTVTISCCMGFVLPCLGPEYNSLRRTSTIAVQITEDVDLLAEILRWHCVHPCAMSLGMFPHELYAQVRPEVGDGVLLRQDRYVEDDSWPGIPACSVCLTLCEQRCILRFKEYIPRPVQLSVRSVQRRHSSGRPLFDRAFQDQLTRGRPWKYVCGMCLAENMKLWWDGAAGLLSRHGFDANHKNVVVRWLRQRSTVYREPSADRLRRAWAERCICPDCGEPFCDARGKVCVCLRWQLP